MPGITHQLVVTLSGNVVQTALLGTQAVTIGRVPESGLPLQNPMVSRQHAEVRLDPQGIVLTDLGSANGTFVRGERLLPHQPTVLAPGGTFEIAPFLVTYMVTAVPDAAQAGEPAPALAPAPPDLPPPPPPPAAELVAVEPSEPPAPPMPPREAGIVPLAPGPHSPYVRDLPMIFHDNDFLGRFLLIFESIWEPLERRQDHIHMYFDPRTAPRSFLPFLASWVGSTFDPHWPESRIRAFVANALDLYSWRGTPYGLTRMLEVCAGVTPRITEPADQPHTFHISVTIPPQSEVDRDLIELLIIQHKPAHVGYMLEVRASPAAGR